MQKFRSLLILSCTSILLTSCGLFANPSSNELEEEIVDNTENEEIEEPTSDPEPPVVDNKKVVSLYAVGDNLIHSPIFNYAQQDDGTYDFKPIYQHIAEDIKNADLAFINQESPIAGDDLGFSGYPSFNTPSDMIPNLVDLGFDLVVGSNNHTLDKGTRGVYNTVEYWQEYEDDILFTGIFNSLQHRDAIPIIERNDITFSVLTYTYGTNGIIPEEPYFVNYFDPELITEDVARAQEMSDFIIVSAHWGDEHAFAPNQMQEEYAQLFADLGVDLVIGTHSHTIQPIEWVTGENGNETLVIYSLGNLIAASVSDINLLGGSVSLDIVKDEEDLYIENITFEPLVIHYTMNTPGDINSRSNFEVYKLDEYSDDLAAQHALNGYQDNVISIENYQNIVNEVINAEHLK